MSYKSYTASVRYAPEDDVFCGRVDDISDRIIFVGASVDELKKEFQESIDFYLESCAETGDVPQRPSSETMQIRFAANVSSAARAAAARAGQSISDWLQALAARETGVAL